MGEGEMGRKWRMAMVQWGWVECGGTRGGGGVCQVPTSATSGGRCAPPPELAVGDVGQRMCCIAHTCHVFGMHGRSGFQSNACWYILCPVPPANHPVSIRRRVLAKDWLTFSCQKGMYILPALCQQRAESDTGERSRCRCQASCCTDNSDLRSIEEGRGRVVDGDGEAGGSLSAGHPP